MKRSIFAITFLALAGCLFFAGIAPSAPPQNQAGKTRDDFMLNTNTLDESRAARLKELIGQRASGVPFAVQEIEILDAFQAGLSITSVEADVVIARALYDTYVAGKPLGKERDLLERYRAYNNAHAQDTVARNAELNANVPEAQGTRAPDGSRDWELYSDPELFNQLSSAYQNRLERIYGHKGKVRSGTSKASQAEENPDATLVVPNTLVNNPAADATTQDTQSETTIILGAGSNILCSFNDSGSDLGGSNHFTGIALSTNTGDAWTDQGTLPSSTSGDAGDPVYARSASTGTAILSTLGFASGAVLQIFRTTDNGASYLAPVDGAAAGGGSLDKEWVAADNFAGAGQGNFYMFFRNFGTGGGMTFTRSTNDGVTWGNRQILASASGQGAWPVVGADHAVYCFWLATGNVLAFKKSTDQGITFGAQTTVTTLRTTGTNGDLGLSGGFRTNAFMQVVAHPTVANQLYAVWDDKGISPSTDKANIYFSQTLNGGATWSAPIQVNTDAGTNDQWQAVIAITPDGTGLFISWYDRRLDAGNALIDVFGRSADISGATVSFGFDYRITDTAFPSVIGQDPVINTVYMGDYDSAVADNTTYYRTWGDNRLPLNTHAHQPDVRFTKIPKGTGSGPFLVAAGSSLTAESCTPANSVPDPGEAVTFNLSLMNSGNASTTNLVATLQATGGVVGPSGPQNYGAMAPGNTVARSFSFTVGTTCGQTLVATLQLQDGATNLGTVTFNFVTGVTTTTTAFSENFDGVVAPALPAGWAAANAAGAAPLWVTSVTTPDTAPNTAFIDDPATVSDKRLDTPGIAVTSALTQVSFRNFYNLESTFDGGVLEVSSPNIAGGAFTDITNVAVGGSFVSGGYNATISTAFSSPIAGRMAWSGNSGTYITTVANLGPNVNGQTIKLRFRMGSDSSVAATGWRVDTIQIAVTGFVCCTGAPTPTPIPTPSPTATPSPVPTATPSPTPTPIPTVGISGTITYCSNPVPGPVANVTLTLTGTSGGTTLSDGSGNYSFTGLASGGTYTVTPTKTALTPGTAGITTVDVIATQRHFLNVVLLTGCRLIAGDVNGDTVVNTVDVIAIQRFFLALSTGIANTGKYSFSPASRSYSPLTSDQTAENYDTLIFGDVASPYADRAGGPSPDAASEVAATVAEVVLPDVAVDRSMNNFVAAVTTSAIEGKNKLVGFQGDFTFDERVVSFESQPVQPAGLTARNWNVSGNVLPGSGPIRTLRLSAYSLDFKPLSGSGTLFELRMSRVSEAAQTRSFIWAAPPDHFIFIDADLNTQRPTRAAPGSIAPSER